MQFLYHSCAGEESITLDGEAFSYLIKVRRAKQGENLALRHLRDENLYTYCIAEIQPKKAILLKQGQRESPTYKGGVHLLWAIIEPKVIEKTLPMLNELGVSQISFFYADYSQRQFKLSLERMHKILINSCQQCGRSHLMKIEMLKDFAQVCEIYQDFYAFDFGGNDIKEVDFTTLPYLRVMIGAEGGFSMQERARFSKVITSNDQLILRSESASVLIAALARLRNT